MARPLAVEIVDLRDRPDAGARLIAWFETEWAPWYGPDGEGDAAADIAACLDPAPLPLCLVAVSAAHGVVGTAALRDDALGSELGYRPWLAGLLVGPAFRGRRVASALTAAIEAEARRLGLAAIYCAAGEGTRLLARRGWIAFDRIQSLRGTVAVHRRDLTPEVARVPPAD